MGVSSWVIPVAVLGAIVALGFVFVWWWFPRAWKKGDQSDINEVNRLNGPEREEQRRKNREIIDRHVRALAIERGEIVDDGEGGVGVPPPPPAYEVGKGMGEGRGVGL
ncbi:hypothetical protein LTR01_003826 [Friedmanniomyces endolithicus]|nr:hypothetical protein LTR01_003826 [Friedmanniomyces endolithicus]KAK0835693.1 hypothetical protein LTR73_000192 [Friedmanniomyces endolithicus]